MTETFAQTSSHSQLQVRVPHYLRTPLLLMTLFTATQVLVVLVAYFKIQPEIPLFYSLPGKAQSLAAKEWLFLFPAVAAAVTIVHTFILQSLNEADRILLKIFVWTSVALVTLVTLALARILLIVW